MAKSKTKERQRSSHENPPEMSEPLIAEDVPGFERVSVITGNPRPANTPRGMLARAYNEKHNQHKSKVAKLRAKFRNRKPEKESREDPPSEPDPDFEEYPWVEMVDVISGRP